jgi:tripartite-type tricarboxylate transporter receptor subunit TctC
MDIDRRQATLALLALLGSATPLRAQPAYPSRPIRVIVGYSPGGAVDIVARAVGEQLSAGLGQPIVVENKPGAGTNIANRALIDSAPDGHTLMVAANALAANVSLYKPAPYDLADVTPIAQLGRVPVVLAVNAAAPMASIKDLIDQARARPDTITYGSPGNGSTPHLAIELFGFAAGARLNHVPYKGGSQALTDAIAGHIQAVAVNALEALPHVRSGKLRVLAALSEKRSPIFPEAPTIAESGFPGFEASVWYALIGPKGLPAPVVARLHQEAQKALAQPGVRDRLTSAGGEVTPGPVSMLAALLASEKARYEKLIRDAKIQPD